MIFRNGFILSAVLNLTIALSLTLVQADVDPSIPTDLATIHDYVHGRTDPAHVSDSRLSETQRRRLPTCNHYQGDLDKGVERVSEMPPARIERCKGFSPDYWMPLAGPGVGLRNPPCPRECRHLALDDPRWCSIKAGKYRYLSMVQGWAQRPCSWYAPEHCGRKLPRGVCRCPDKCRELADLLRYDFEETGATPIEEVTGEDIDGETEYTNEPPFIPVVDPTLVKECKQLTQCDRFLQPDDQTSAAIQANPYSWVTIAGVTYLIKQTIDFFTGGTKKHRGGDAKLKEQKDYDKCFCDYCFGDIPKGTNAYSCRGCDLDICVDCEEVLSKPDGPEKIRKRHLDYLRRSGHAPQFIETVRQLWQSEAQRAREARRKKIGKLPKPTRVGRARVSRKNTKAN